MKIISIVNFELTQHYKDRCPPWIKLHGKLWNDPGFFDLSDTSKAHFLGLMILASRHNNRIPFKEDWISSEIKATDKINYAAMKEANLIEISGKDASRPLAERKHYVASGIEETETEERESRGEREKEGKAAKPEKRASRPIDSAAEMFKEAWNLKRAPDVYEWHSGDFPQLAKLRKRLGLNGSTPPDWERAIANYFATRQKAHTLADLAVNYGVFVNEALDRFGKPIGGEYAEPESSEQGKARRTREASEQLLARRFESTGGFLPH